MKRLYTFLKYQYNNKILLWIIIMVITSFASTYGALKAFRASRDISISLCAKDVLLIRSFFYIFIYICICVIKIIILTYVDDKPNILIRYNSKEKIFIYQSLSALIIALVDIIIMYVTSIFSAYIILDQYDNWTENGSLFYRMAVRNELPPDIGVNDVCIYINLVIRISLIIWLVTIIGLLSEVWFNKLRTVVIMLIATSAFSYSFKYGMARLNLSVMEMYNMRKVIVKTVILFAVCIVLVITGTILSKKRQYYK